MADNELFLTKRLNIPIERRCTDCAYFAKHLFYSGKWYCRHPEKVPGAITRTGKPCFVARGSKEAHDLGI